MAELGYFERAVADGPVFIEMVKRYGVEGVLNALQNFVRTNDTREIMCSNKCSVGSNIVWELQACERAIKKWKEDAR